MAYLHSGHEKYPLRLGHEWCGVISEVGEGVDKKHLGKRVTGDTMLDRKSTRLNSSHIPLSRMPSSA